MIAVPSPPGFFASIEDNACSAAAGELEYSHLITGLDELVIPALWQATKPLQACGFKPSQVGRHGGLAGMVVQRHEPAAGAWLYFQLHRNPGPGPANECVLWMYAIHHPAGITASRPRRLAHLDAPEEVEEIVNTFVQACAKAPGYRDPATPAAPPAGERVLREATRPAIRRVRGAFVSA